MQSSRNCEREQSNVIGPNCKKWANPGLFFYFRLFDMTQININ